MKFFAAVLFCSIAAVSCDTCYKSTHNACQDSGTSVKEPCSASYGAANTYMNVMNDYVNEQITHSLQYLLMSSSFGSYKQSREGFEKLFRKLSDESWEDAIDLIKYITMRGGVAELKPCFHKPQPISFTSESSESTPNVETSGCRHPSGSGPFFTKDIQMREVYSLAEAVDVQKKLAERAHAIYNKVNPHDPEMGSYVEDKFMHRYAKSIRSLVGLANDLSKLLNVETAPSAGLQHYIMDEYLQKIL